LPAHKISAQNQEVIFLALLTTLGWGIGELFAFCMFPGGRSTLVKS
jgi:hypothetical protein